MNRLKPGEARTVTAAQRRTAILAFLEDDPGASLRRICKRLALAGGVARHHIMILEREGRLWHERLAGRDWYFTGRRPQTRRGIATALQSGLPHELHRAMKFIRTQGPLCQREALDALPWPRSTSQHRLDRLVRMGHLRRRPQGRYVLYEVVA